MTKKLRKRGGRPRIVDAERWPSGRIKYDRDVTKVAIDARMRHYGVTRVQAKSADFASMAGLLHYQKRITERQRDAAHHIAKAFNEYCYCLDIPPPNVKAINYEMRKGAPREVSPNRQKRAIQEWALICNVVRRAAIIKRKPCRRVMERLQDLTVYELAEAQNWNDETIALAQIGLTAVADLLKMPENNLDHSFLGSRKGADRDTTSS